MIRRDTQGIAQHDLASTRALGAHGDAHQTDPRVHVVGRNLQHVP